MLAEAICRDLELGSLLGKMPNGIHQVVGETGWQLSHGERSRVFLARALLQQADVLILDESFAALDPETEKAPTLVRIGLPPGCGLEWMGLPAEALNAIRRFVSRRETLLYEAA